MSWRKHKSRGFTLIEIIIVLAISSALTIILFTSYSQTRQRAQFTDAIERVVTTLEAAKTEAVSTVNTNPNSPGTSPDQIVFAKVADLAADPGQINIRTLLADRQDSLSGVVLGSPDPTRTAELTWGVTFQAVGSDSTHDFIAFTRSPADGRLNTYVFDVATISNLVGAGGQSLFATTGNGADTAVATLAFQSPDGLRAEVQVNAGTSEITREFLN